MSKAINWLTQDDNAEYVPPPAGFGDAIVILTFCIFGMMSLVGGV
jgi:hypothetical protein